MKLLNKLTIIFVILFAMSNVLLSSDYNSDKSIKYENFTLFDYNQNEHSLTDFADKKGIVVMFISTHCPVSNAYNSRMEEVFNKYKDNFSFVGINSNKAEDTAEIKEHASENNLNFVILKDVNNIIADKFNASFTPEFYVLNNDLEQVYHGRLDDSRRADEVTSTDLKNTLEEIKNGKEVSVKETKAFGCTIKRVEK